MGIELITAIKCDLCGEQIEKNIIVCTIPDENTPNGYSRQFFCLPCIYSIAKDTINDRRGTGKITHIRHEECSNKILQEYTS